MSDEFRIDPSSCPGIRISWNSSRAVLPYDIAVI